MEKLFGLSKIRNKNLAFVSLLRKVRNISIIVFILCITAAAVWLVSDNSKLFAADKESNVQSEEAVISYKNTDTSINAMLCISFNSSIHTDSWQIYLNNELFDTFETKNGVSADYKKEAVLQKEAEQSLELKSVRGKELTYSINDLLSEENIVNIEIEGDFKPAAVKLQLQNPELPNGCEATSLAMLMSAAGIETDKLEAAQAIPTEDFSQDQQGRLCAPNPEQFYAGKAESKTRGFYAFVPPVKQAAENLIKDAGLCLQAVDLTGSEFQEIEKILENGSPVMLWITIDYGKLRYCENFSWIQTDTSESYLPIANLHCVLAEYKDEESFTVFDPIKGELNISSDKLKYVYEQMGKRALYIG